MQKELKVILLTSVFINIAAGLFGPLYAVFVEEIGGSLSVAGFAYSIFAIVTGVLMFFVSKWEDHIKHQEKLIIVGRFLSVIGFAGYLLVRNPMHLYMVQFIFGVATAIYAPALQSIFAKHLDKGKFASEFGIWGSIVWFVAGVSAIIGGILAENFGFRVIFWIMLGFAILSLLSSVYLLNKGINEKNVAIQ